jgi:hypothetical protein
MFQLEAHMQEILRNSRVSRALESITGKVAMDSNKERLLRVFSILAAKRPLGRNYHRKDYSSDTSKTWKQLSDFPRRIESMAEEISKVQNGIYFQSDAPEEFASLHLRLVEYAFWLRSHIEQLPLGPVGGNRDLASIVRLSNYVKKHTGRFQDKEVAALIEAVRYVIYKDEEFGVDAQDLADIRSRYKRRTSKT